VCGVAVSQVSGMGKIRVSHIGHCRFFKWNRHALDSTAECAEARRGLKTVSKLCVLRGDKIT